MKITKKAVAAGIAGIALLSVAGTSVSSADPADGLFRPYSGVGSDTTDAVMNGLSEVVVDGSNNKLLASYDAFAPSGGNAFVQTKNAANCWMTRPGGSGNGRTALNASVVGGNSTFAANPDGTPRTGDVTGCVDFARTSTFPAPTTAFSAGKGAFTYVQLATDALAYATLNTSTVPKSLNKTQLKGLYQCTALTSLKPMLPQSGSGMRQSFLASIGITFNATVGSFPADPNGIGACVQDSTAGVGVGNPSNIPENDGSYVTLATQVMPWSVAQYLSQSTGGQTFLVGRMQLRAIDFQDGQGVSSPTVINGNGYGATRVVYNSLPTAKISQNVTVKPTTITGGSNAVLVVGNASDVAASIAAGNAITVSGIGAGFDGTIAAANVSVTDNGATGTAKIITLTYPAVGGSATTPGSIPANALVSALSTQYDPTLAGIFVGPTSKICQATSTIKRFGFLPDANCGDTSAKSG